MVIVKWSGKYPCLCHGKWTLIINGTDYSHMIPKERRTSHMNTYGTYKEWHLENWLEVFEDYEDGLEYEDWIKENLWVLNLPAAPQDIYIAFQDEDWRHNSCGGCI